MFLHDQKFEVLEVVYKVHERKYCDMSVIYRVSEGMDTIFYGEISIRRNFGRNPQKFDDISIYIIWSMRVNKGQTRYNEAKRIAAIVPQKYPFCCWDSIHLPLGQACPLLNIMH